MCDSGFVTPGTLGPGHAVPTRGSRGRHAPEARSGPKSSLPSATGGPVSIKCLSCGRHVMDCSCSEGDDFFDDDDSLLEAEDVLEDLSDEWYE